MDAVPPLCNEHLKDQWKNLLIVAAESVKHLTLNLIDRERFQGL